MTRRGVSLNFMTCLRMSNVIKLDRGLCLMDNISWLWRGFDLILSSLEKGSIISCRDKANMLRGAMEFCHLVGL